MSKMILRKCISCNQLKDRAMLLRVIKLYDSHEIVISPNSKQFGRSLYLCYNSDCIQLAIKKKRLQKFLRRELSEELILKIKKLAE
ncbi:MAG: YlxR family protein [bacterium]